MLDTVVPLLTAKLKLVGVAVAAVALSSSAVAVTTVSSDEPLPDDAAVSLEAPDDALDPDAVATPAEPTDAEPTDADAPDAEAPDAEEDGTAEDEDGAEPGAAAPGDADLPPCPADVRNHGAYVSSVARDRAGSGREHGARVSAAARSDCGAPTGDGGAEMTEPGDGEVEAQRAPGPPAERKGAKPDEGTGAPGLGKAGPGKGGGKR